MADIIITKEDLKDPSIDDVVNLQRSLQPQGGERIEDIKTPFHHNPIFYYSIAAALGSVTAWGLWEPYFDDQDGPKQTSGMIMSFLLFGGVAGTIGLAIGAVYGISNRNMRQSLYCSAVGAGVGLAATILTTFIASIVYAITSSIAVSMIEHRQYQPGEYPLKGMAFFIHMCGRGIAWSIVSMGAGLGLGIALKSKKLVLNGFVGGMVGGLLGGMFFDPIERFVTPGTHDASLSRGVGIFAVGLFVGLFIGIFENLSKEAWFLMLKGPLAGKQFIIFKSPMKIGSSPKSEIYLFKDANIEPLHASVTRSGSKYLLTDENSDAGTFVNGRKVDKYILQNADTITIGEAVLRYSEKSKG